MQYIHEGKSDKEIASLTNTSASTVRHQRFVFREKARQAKMYLALYELSVEGMMDNLLEVHDHAAQVDERYVATSEDEEQVLKTMTLSTEPLKLKQITAKEKKKIIYRGVGGADDICRDDADPHIFCRHQFFEKAITVLRKSLDAAESAVSGELPFRFSAERGRSVYFQNVYQFHYIHRRFHSYKLRGDDRYRLHGGEV